MLFLNAGLVVHATLNQQDSRRLGAKWKKFTILSILLVIGSFNLIRFPFLTGFYSKELILDGGISLWNQVVIEEAEQGKITFI